MMCLARCYHQQQATLDLERRRLIQSYRERISQSLILGNYMRCPPYTIETLLLFFEVEYIRSKDTHMENWVLLGLVIRLALRAGYHRDASNYPEISPFDGEMRRRVWATILQFEALASIQVGLPSMIKESQCDTAEPLNLLDEDLDESMTALTLPRPDTVQTPIQYLLAKNKIASIHSKISDLITAVKPPPYAEVMSLDKALNSIYSSNPQSLQMLPMVKLLIDTPDIIIRRVNVAILYQRAKCILHQKFMLPGRTDSQYAYSRSTCIQAALQILECHWILNHEIHAGGKLYLERWEVSWLDKSSFYLAAALLCLVLDDYSSDNSISDQETSVADSDMMQRIVQTLYISYQIWVQEISTSKEAQKMVNALRSVLEKAQNMRLGESTDKSMMLGDMPVAGSSATGTFSTLMTSRLTRSLFLPLSNNKFIYLEPSTRMETDSAPPQINPSPNDMSIHVLLRHNASAEIDYSDIEFPRQSSNPVSNLLLHAKQLWLC
jgi:hypothetical protein